jgi:YVTN family beta-propeller protein
MSGAVAIRDGSSMSTFVSSAQSDNRQTFVRWAQRKAGIPLVRALVGAASSVASRLASTFSVLTAAAAMLAATSVGAQPNVNGTWSAVITWPLIPIHATLMPDGRVLTYGSSATGQQGAFFIYDVWDPTQGLSNGHMTLNNLTQTDIFCSSQVVMPQNGQVLISGGDNWTGSFTTNTGNADSSIFNPAGNILTNAGTMNRSRWYSSSTVLVNGDVYIHGGNGGSDFPEVHQQNGAFRLLTGADTSGFDALFPRNYIAPDGRVFGYDASGRMFYADASGLGSISPQGQFSSANAGSTASGAMFRPGKILQFGGNSNGATVIDINGPQPVVTATQAMSTQRQWVNATVLPNGQVLATGGSRVANTLTGVNNGAEIWDPATGTWHVGTSGVKPRLYHSTALLMQDGSVLVGGGGASDSNPANSGPVENLNIEVYYPPYLYNSSGVLATRPQIVNAPSSADVGTTLPFQVGSTDIARVTLVKTGSVTHSVNMDQRFIELPFTQSSTQITAFLPARASDTPPGFYHLFVINSAGVPSKSSILQINIDSTPNTAVDFTPTIGGTGGTAFQLSCAADEVLVGVYGKYQTGVNQIGPECVRVDQFGRWIGTPVQRALTGTTTTGTAFDKQCARDNAMSGFRGNSSSTVDQIEIQCRTLTSIGGLTGTGTFLGPSGGTGGTPQPLQACGTENPVYALYGSSGTTINSFGVLCRPGVITPISTNSAPVVVNPGNQTAVTGNAVSLQIQASDADSNVLTYTASNLPTGLQINQSTGLITGTPTVPGDFLAIVSVSDGVQTAIAAFHWIVSGNALLTVAPMPPQPTRLAAAPISYTASATGGVNVVYKWQFDDGTPDAPFSSSPTVTHTFALPGIYFITLTVNDDLGVPSTQSFVQTIHLPLTASAPRNSGSIAYETRSGANSRVWLVNQDNDTVSVFDAVTNVKTAEIAVGAAPRSVAVAPDGRLWVTNRDPATISIISPSTLAVVQTVTLSRASQPYGVVFSSPANQAFVALAAAGLVVKLDATSGAQLGSLSVGPEPRQLSLDSTGTKLYVSRFITPRQPGEETAVVSNQIGGVPTGGQVLVLDAGSMTLLQTVTLQHSAKTDAENQGSGVPNYLGAPVISPDGKIASVPSKQDNIARGTLRSGLDLNFQNTVRAITSRIDLTAGAEDYPHRIDHDNSSVAAAVAYDPTDVYMFVALETSREVAVVDVYEGVEIFRFAAGRAPQGVVVSPDGQRLYVNSFMDRTLSVFDLSQLMTTGQWNVPLLAALSSVTTEKLAATVLAGKQIFYDAKDTRLARDSYMSCASCHNDGGQDGRVWDFTGKGEGLRNTINLRGGPSSALGRMHWTGNFDEVQDFEGQIRAFAGGTGLMSDTAFNTGTRNQPLGDPKAGLSPDLDALAAYVGSLGAFAPSPYRAAGGVLTSDAVAGRTIFNSVGCASCHSGNSFTNSNTNVLQDVGTIKQPTSGQRLGGPLTGLDTPTLCSVWATAPYLHDGSATSISSAITAHSAFSSLLPSDLAQLAAYVQQIDATTAPDCAPIAPFLPLAFAHSGAAVADASGTTLSVQLSGVKTGSLLVAYMKWEGTPAATLSVSDGTTTFTADAIDTAANNDLNGRFYYLPASSASGTVTYTATWSAARPFRKMMVYEYSYSGGTVTLDASNRATGTSGSLNSGNITTTGADEIVFGAYGEYDIFTTNTELIGGLAADQVVRANFSSMWSKSFSAPFTGAATASGNSPTWVGGVIALKHVASATNTAPTISNIADRSTLEDTGTGAIAFTVGDAETAAGSLTLSGTSSNQSVVANSGIVFGGSGANRTVAVTPVANANGAATITVTVSDGSLTGSDTFVLTVIAVNDPPTISSVASQTGAAGVPVGPLALTVGDIETPAASLTLSATSSDTVLVPIANIVFGGSGANRSVTVTPAAGSTGSAVITLTVNDGTTTAATSFNLTVTATNTPPTITNIADLSTAEDTATPAIAFTVGDAETLVGNLTLSGTSSNASVVANSGIVFGGSGANRTVTVTPVANANGTSTITVTVSDGQATATDTFVLTVTAVNDPPTISSVANQTTSIGVAVGPLAVTVGDVETAAASLTLTGSSSNTTLVPNANITFGGAGANRTVTVTPAAGATGVATITLNVNDGTVSTPTTFTFTVTSTPPAPLAFAHSGSALSDTNATTLSAQMTGVKAGSLIVAFVKWEGSPASTVTLSDGTSTFTADTINTAANNDLNGRFYYLLSSSASGTVTYTATWSVARPYRKLMLFEYSYTGGTVAFDASNRATATSGTLSSGNITTTGTDEVVFGGYGEYDAAITTTERVNGVAADQVVRASYGSMWSKTFTSTFTGAATASGNSSTWVGNAIAFKHVTAPNTPPTITNIADLSTAEDTATPAIAFTVGDAETAAASLTVSGTSSNQSVVANSGIAFGGSGANRTVTLTPVANANGTATITVTVGDGQATATATFVLTVTAVNDPPTISSVANQTTSIGVAVGPLAVTVGDIETAAASLTLTGSSSNTTLVPNANITFGGAGANRTVTVTPAAGASGTANLTLTVNDGTTTTTTSFTLTVSAIPPAPLTFAHSGSAFTDASGTTQTVQLTGVTTGSLIVAYVKWEGTPASTVTFSDGTSTFTADAIDTAANNDLNGRFYYLPSSTKSGTVTYTATWSAARPYRRVMIYEYAYSGGSVSFDASTRATATTGTLSSGNITTTGTDEVVFGAYGEYDAATTTTERVNGVAADQVVRASYASMWSKTVTSTFTGAATASGNSSTWIGNVIAFKHTIP